MKFNNRGFSLVEMLAVVAILGILFGIGIQAYSMYTTKTINQGFDILAESSINGFEQYLLDHPFAEEVNIDVLVNENYLENNNDPANKGGTCDGTVRLVDSGDDSGGLKKNSYVLDLCCANRNYQYDSNGRKVKTSVCQANFNEEKYIEKTAANCGSGKTKIRSFNIYTMNYLSKICTKNNNKYGSCSDDTANLPCRRYKYYQYRCRCTYSKVSNKYCSSEITSSSDHVMKIRYFDNSNGLNACNSDTPSSFNSYVSQVCVAGVYEEGKNVMTFHGYQFFKGQSSGYTDFRPEGTWFHDELSGITLEDRVTRGENNADGTPDSEKGCRDTCIRFTEALSGKVN